ncbi:MAG: glycosyltransferase family 2 protein [Candidatus Aenigmarchaeota archaeon]|nr:glycosyltransferase family 2 protein [Candidatus Aenigmarchaeota archaeon]
MLSIIVPCYNEERNLPFLLERFEKVLQGMDAELILVNNGSTDNSQQVLEKIAKEYSFVRIAIVAKNIGYGYGIMTGLKAAKGGVLAWTHADMQCDPEDIAKAYDVYKKSDEKTLVKGNRQGRFSLLTKSFHVVTAILFFRRFDDINGQPKMFPRSLLDEMKNPPTGFQLDFYVQYTAKKKGYRVLSIPVKFGVRKFGYSKWATGMKSRIKNVARFLGYMLKLRFIGG